MERYAYETRSEAHVVLPVEESVWSRRGLWPSILLGAVVGFAVTVILGTFGAATGLTAGAAAADENPRAERYGERDRTDRVVAEAPPAARTEERIAEPERTRESSAPRQSADSRRMNDQSSTHPSIAPPAQDRTSRERTAEPAPVVATREPVQDRPAQDRMVQDRTSEPDRDAAATRVTTEDERDAMKGAAVGGALWMILTALAAGLIGGIVAGRFAQVFTTESTIVGAATWSVGILIMAALAAFGASGLLGGVGAGAGELLNGREANVDSETGKAVAASATIATWGFFVALLIGLGASILGASKSIKRRVHLYAKPERPYVTNTPISPAMP